MILKESHITKQKYLNTSEIITPRESQQGTEFKGNPQMDQQIFKITFWRKTPISDFLKPRL